MDSTQKAVKNQEICEPLQGNLGITQSSGLDGNVFSYAVSSLETLSSYAISDMTSGDWDLTLFTCTVGGQSRLAIRCDQAE